MKNDTELDDRGHAIALAAIAVLALSLSGATLLGGPDRPLHAGVSTVYTDEIAAGVLVYRMPALDAIAQDLRTQQDAIPTAHATQDT